MNVAAGTAYLVLVRRSGTPDFGAVEKLAPATNVDEWTALSNFADRLVTDATAHGVVRVGFAETRKYGSWPYRMAFARAAMEVSAALALRRQGIPCEIVPQKTAAASLDLALGEMDAELRRQYALGKPAPAHVKERMPALAVALHLAKEQWS